MMVHVDQPKSECLLYLTNHTVFKKLIEDSLLAEQADHPLLEVIVRRNFRIYLFEHAIDSSF